MNFRKIQGILFFLTLLLSAERVWATGFTLPSPVVPDGLGLNIHFTDPLPGEMEMLAKTGVRWVRMDLSWNQVEREKGHYDFSAFDRLVQALEPHGIRILLILCYGNPLYDEGFPPHTEESREAFARWAAASAKHFAGRGFLWEMWNEPNIELFWTPKSNVEDYIKLAHATGQAIHGAAPNEIFVGPATSNIDLKFLKACFEGGLLEEWAAVTVHPYRWKKDPESALVEYSTLRRMIEKYAPPRKEIPILSGEWGYASSWPKVGEGNQAKFLPRQWLIHLMSGIPLSIWYDWRDDGLDPQETEHHFGIVHHTYQKGSDPVFEPKPAYRTAQTLITQLQGFQFYKRLAVGGPDDYLLLFKKGDFLRLTAWTRDPQPHSVLIPSSPGLFRAIGPAGEEMASLPATSGLRLTLSDSPQYFIPDGANPVLQEASSWDSPSQSLPSAGKRYQSLIFQNQ